MVRFPGFFPQPGVDWAEYRDWLAITLNDREFEFNRDYMPVGLVVEWIKNGMRRYGLIHADPRGGRLIGPLR